jgi:hypothetical protein
MVTYRTSDQGVIAGYQAAAEAVSAYTDQLSVLLDTLAPGLVRRFTSGYRPGRLLGLVPYGEIPEGWRLDVTLRLLKPNLRKHTGREISRRIDSLRYPGDLGGTLTGMASAACVDGVWLTGSVHVQEDMLYVVWAASAGDLGEPPDPAIWEQV